MLLAAPLVAVAAALPSAPAASAAPAGVAPVNGAWQVRGHGYGHGKGLSQWGAQTRAVAGQSAATILDFYYPGTTSSQLPGRTLRVRLDSQAGDVVVVRSADARELTLSTSARTVRADQVLRLSRDGAGVLGVALDAGGAVAWTEAWPADRIPVVTAGGRFALVAGSGASTVYEGTLTLSSGGGRLAPVNTVDLEAYLRGVVPAESPSSWRPAALQAQAVAARSYVLSTLPTAASSAHDTCDTTSCQVYRGFELRSPTGALTWSQPQSTNDAIAATAGQVRTSDGRTAAFTQFSSSNGGWSAAGTQSYLAAREDPFSLRTGTPAGDAVGSWTASLPVAEVSQRCPAGGVATALDVVSRDGNGEWGGRITELSLTCTTGTVALRGVGASRFSMRSSWWQFTVTSDGALDAAWEAAGGAGGDLGDAMGAEVPTPDGRGVYRHHAGGSIYWTPATGARIMTGALREKWASLGWERSFLAYPVTHPTGLATTPAGVYQHFQGGSLYWTEPTGAHTVTGGIRDQWARRGWERSSLGYPVNDTTRTPDGKGSYQVFRGGSLYATPASGIHIVSGPIGAKWGQLGWERSAVGWPTMSPEWVHGGNGASYQHFTGGSVYSSPAGGVRAVVGPAREAWAKLGWERSRLGYPTGDTTATARGTTTAFQGGTITYDAATKRTTTTYR